MPRLRGHHLVCLQFFVGKGYDRRFVRNVCRVIERAKRGRIVVVSGRDDVCVACPRKCVGVEELDDLALELLCLRVGDRVRWDEVRRRVRRILPVWTKRACRGCVWWRVCKRETLKFKCQPQRKHG